MDFKEILNVFFTGLNTNLKKGFASVVSELKKSNSGNKEVSKAVNDQTSALRTIFTNFNRALEKVSKPEINVEVNFDGLKAILGELKTILVSIQKRKEVSLAKVETELGLIRRAIKENDGGEIVKSFDAFGKEMKELKPKKTVRIDDEQLSKLVQAVGGGANFAGNGGAKSGTTYTIQTLTLTDANTEYEFTFPRGTVSWTMKLRAAGDSLFYAAETGKLPSSGDGSAYMTLLPGLSAQAQDNVDYGGHKMFFESDGAGNVVEFMVAQL